MENDVDIWRYAIVSCTPETTTTTTDFTDPWLHSLNDLVLFYIFSIKIEKNYQLMHECIDAGVNLLCVLSESNYVSSAADAGLTKGASAAGKRKSYGVQKVHSHRSDHKQVLSSSRAKRASMPCMGTSCSDSSVSVARRMDGRKPGVRDGDRFYSASVDETDEWAQVMI